MDRIQVILIVLSALFILFIIELTRKKRIREQYSLIWLLIGLVLLTFSIFRGLLDHLAAFLGVYYAPSLIIPILIFLGLFLGIHFSVVISRLKEENKKLTQEVGLLEARVKKIEKEREKKGE